MKPILKMGSWVLLFDVFIFKNRDDIIASGKYDTDSVFQWKYSYLNYLLQLLCSGVPVICMVW